MNTKKTKKKFNDVPLSQTNVSLGIAEIQKRFSELAENDEVFDILSLDDSASDNDKRRPFHYG